MRKCAPRWIRFEHIVNVRLRDAMYGRWRAGVIQCGRLRIVIQRKLDERLR